MKVKIILTCLLLFSCISFASEFDSLYSKLSKNPSDKKQQEVCLQYLIDNSNIPAIQLIEHYTSLSNLLKNEISASIQCDIAARLANLYNTIGDYSKALHHGLIAEKIALRTNKKYLPGIYNIIGNTYLGLKKNESMIEAFQNCYNYAKQFKDIKSMAYGAAGLGNYYGTIQNFELSNKWNLEALKSFDVLKQRFAQCIIRINLSSNYRQLKKYNTSTNYINEAEKYLEDSKLNYCYELFYSERGLLYLATNKYNQAIQDFKKSIEYGKLDNARHNLSEHYYYLSKAYQQAGSYHLAFEALSTHLKYKDSVFNEESNQQLLELEEKYKSEKKDTEIRLLTKTNQLNNSELKRKSMLIWIFGIGSIVIFGLLFFLIISIRSKNKINNLLEHKNKEIEDKQNEIVSSINYAKRIQFTLLASDYLLSENLMNYFVLFRPKDIVSGDFYWAIKTNTHFFLAVCDCTGHGVPGAFMSLLNINFLKEAITEKNIEKPGEIFDFVRARLIENLAEEGQNDGMDGTLIAVNLHTSEIQYAGANRAPLLISNGEIVELEYDKMPIGKGVKSDSFKNNILTYKKGDSLYLFTDGFADQFGGEAGKKFKVKNFKNLLNSFSSQPPREQKIHIEESFDRWKGNIEQLDDVCVFGIQL